MAQLVGCRCARCQKTIASVVVGEFCSSCGNPVHGACKVPAQEGPRECQRCGCNIDNPLAIEVRKELALNAPRPSTQSALRPVASQADSTPLHVNKLSMRLLLGGSVCVLLGIAAFMDGAMGGSVDAIIGGLVWKGPILAVAGAGAAYYGYRLMTDRGPEDPKRPPTAHG